MYPFRGEKKFTTDLIPGRTTGGRAVIDGVRRKQLNSQQTSNGPSQAGKTD